MKIIFTKILQFLCRILPFLFLYALLSLYFANEYVQIGTLREPAKKNYFISTSGSRCVRYSFDYILDDAPDYAWKVPNDNSNQRYTFYVPLEGNEKLIANKLDEGILVERNTSWTIVVIGMLSALMLLAFAVLSAIGFEEADDMSIGPYIWPYRFKSKGHTFIDIIPNIKKLYRCMGK